MKNPKEKAKNVHDKSIESGFSTISYFLAGERSRVSKGHEKKLFFLSGLSLVQYRLIAGIHANCSSGLDYFMSPKIITSLMVKDRQ